MVRSRSVTRFVLIVTPFILCLLLALGVVLAMGIRCPAQEEVTIEEEYTITIDDVGNGKVVDTIKYNKKEIYKAVKSVEKENRGFLARRLNSMDNFGEVVNPDIEMKDSDRTVIITYDYPGFAYYVGNTWMVGIGEKPKEVNENEYTLEESGYLNSEFTLFTDQYIESKTTVKLPEKATNARYDSKEKTINYDMPPAASTLSFWGQNRTLLMIIFGALTVLFLILLIFVLTRKAAPRPAPAAARSAAGFPPPGAPPTAKAAGPKTAPGPPAAEGLSCAKCGSAITPGSKFCTKCGAKIG